jgi:hypothetical protein
MDATRYALHSERRLRDRQFATEWCLRHDLAAWAVLRGGQLRGLPEQNGQRPEPG